MPFRWRETPVDKVRRKRRRRGQSPARWHRATGRTRARELIERNVFSLRFELDGKWAITLIVKSVWKETYHEDAHRCRRIRHRGRRSGLRPVRLRLRWTAQRLRPRCSQGADLSPQLQRFPGEPRVQE